MHTVEINSARMVVGFRPKWAETTQKVHKDQVLWCAVPAWGPRQARCITNQVLRGEPPFSGVPTRSVKKVSKKSEMTWKRVKKTAKTVFGTFSTLFWHSGPGGPGTPLWDFLGISGLGGVETPVYGHCNRKPSEDAGLDKSIPFHAPCWRRSHQIMLTNHYLDIAISRPPNHKLLQTEPHEIGYYVIRFWGGSVPRKFPEKKDFPKNPAILKALRIVNHYGHGKSLRP